MVETATRIYCIMEYLAGGELYDHLYYTGIFEFLNFKHAP